MILTGKCKESFDKWYWTNPEYAIHPFLTIPDSMKYGVLIDFFDSVGLEIQIYVGEFGGWCIVIYNEKTEKYLSLKDNLEDDWLGESRQEAWKKSIEKANEIYNTI